MSVCDCPGPGWCARHKLQKDATWVKLCQERGVYWEAWEAGRGPGQLRSNTPREPLPVEQRGWGDHLTDFLKGLGITEDYYKSIKQKFGLPPTCNCAGRREWLNQVGRWWKERTE